MLLSYAIQLQTIFEAFVYYNKNISAARITYAQEWNQVSNLTWYKQQMSYSYFNQSDKFNSQATSSFVFLIAGGGMPLDAIHM